MRLDVQMETEPELWINGNEGQLHQVIVNLVENAIEAMHSTELPRLVVSAARRGDEVLIRISDNGARDRQGSHRPHLRAVLHHQAGRRGDRTRAVDQLRHRPRTWRRAHRRQRAAGRRYRLVRLAGHLIRMDRGRAPARQAGNSNLRSPRNRTSPAPVAAACRCGGSRTTGGR
jgi:hypothetical protein